MLGDFSRRQLQLTLRPRAFRCLNRRMLTVAVDEAALLNTLNGGNRRSDSLETRAGRRLRTPRFPPCVPAARRHPRAE